MRLTVSSWRRLLRVPWTARRSNQSILKEISPEYSLEGLMLKLKFQYFGHLIWKTDLLEKTLMLGKIKGGRRRGNREWDGWMASPTQWTWVWVNSRSWWWTRKPGMLQSMGSQRVRHDRVAELNWTEIKVRLNIWNLIPSHHLLHWCHCLSPGLLQWSLNQSLPSLLNIVTTSCPPLLRDRRSLNICQNP